MLTESERKAVRLAGELYSLIRDEVCGNGDSRDADLLEVRISIHHVQNWVKAQAAGRAHPGELRLMGDAVGTTEAVPVKSTAVKLLEEALFLRMNGEYAPGGKENWHDWDDKAERFLRALQPPESESEKS